ncbi:hypothetical protein HPB50_013377 [Hyalomma asiaticum]|uniref:Uncharacterized protein n=1 Tax=Hyalomma asiaticum TaxID=266040 RepID=A0ACB7SML2_HYAAI|nr:hypothetical protein HPB50_013377 [Hyalomma asiaticum]
MPKTSEVFKKRRFHANRNESRRRSSAADEASSISSIAAELLQRSSSSKLLHSSVWAHNEKLAVTDSDDALLDSDLLRAAVTESCACKVGGGIVQLSEDITVRSGVA